MKDEEAEAAVYREVMERLTARRKLLNLSQTDVARLSGIQQSNISAMERGAIQRPTWETLVKWAQGLKMEVKMGLILNCAEYTEPYFADLTPKVDAKRNARRSRPASDPRP